MLRNIAAVVAGLVVGGALNMALVLLNAEVLYPMPPGTDMNNPEQLADWIRGLPAPAFLVVMLAHLLQAGVGGYVAARLAASRPLLLALVVGGITLVGGLINLVSLPGPDWLWIEVPLYLLVAWAAGSLELRRRAARTG